MVEALLTNEVSDTFVLIKHIKGHFLSESDPQTKEYFERLNLICLVYDFKIMNMYLYFLRPSLVSK